MSPQLTAAQSSGTWPAGATRCSFRHVALLSKFPFAATDHQSELTYVLDPSVWGRGLATRMARAAIARAFERGAESVLAGADGPNVASVDVMKRLGMRFLRTVEFPSGPGVEYVLARTAFDASDDAPISFVD